LKIRDFWLFLKKIDSVTPIENVQFLVIFEENRWE